MLRSIGKQSGVSVESVLLSVHTSCSAVFVLESRNCSVHSVLGFLFPVDRTEIVSFYAYFGICLGTLESTLFIKSLNTGKTVLDRDAMSDRPCYHAHTRWTPPLPFSRAAPRLMPHRASLQLMTSVYGNLLLRPSVKTPIRRRVASICDFDL